MYYVLLFSFLISACAHPAPREWWPEEHRRMMSECRAMCKGNVESYSPYDGECTCHPRRK